MQEADIVKLAHMDLEKTFDAKNKEEIDANLRFSRMSAD